MINSNNEFKYGDIIYRDNSISLDFYIFVGIADTGIDTHIVGFYLGSFNNIREFKEKFKGLLSGLKESAKVVENYNKWQKTEKNVSVYLVKNQMLHNYKIELGNAKLVKVYDE